MSGQLRVERPGLLSTIQDQGRYGLRHLGIPWSGCLVPGWQQLANTLVGNLPDHSIIESWEGGLKLTVIDSTVRFAVAADNSADVQLESGNRTTRLQPMRSYTAEPGDTLALNTTGNFRVAIIAVAGLDIKPQLGSTSTYAKASLGGLNGAPLTTGAVLDVTSSPSGPEHRCTNPLISAYEQTELRVVIGPQEDHFSAQGLHNLLNGEYTLGSDADRMGVRLSGPSVLHRDDAAKDIVSDAIVPGSIQVPGSGQPIVLLSDAHTAGGYPKIATVISIDLPLLGLHRPGTTIQFRAVTINEAIEAVRLQQALQLKAMRNKQTVVDIDYTTRTLLSINLIDGVTDGQVS